MPRKRRCSATTKAGKPCKSPPLRNRKVCLAHSDAVSRGSVGFTAEAGKQGGRPRQPRTIDVLRERLEERADEIIDVYLDAARAVTHEAVGYGEDREIIEVPDHALRLKAAEALHDRAYGKPKQATEISGPEGGPITHAENSIPDETSFHRQAAKLLAEAGAITAAAGQDK